MKHYPKVKFEVTSLKHILPSMNHFLSMKNLDWGNSILHVHPKLKDELKNIKVKSKRERIIKDYFRNFLSIHNKDLEKSTTKFQKEWNKINKGFMLTLSDVLEIEWPRRDKEIKALVGPNPICPRYIKERIYDIYFDFSNDLMKSTSCHEVLHFLYFEKWKQVFPKTREREFDGPHLVWQLSEMVPKAILLDKRIQKIYEHKPHMYSEYLGKNVDGRPLLKHIGEFYHKRKDFEDFLKNSYEFVKKHEKNIGKI